MDDSVKVQFNTLSSDYDARRRLLIPCFDEFYNSGLNMLTFQGDAPRVLDAGAGTGIFSAFLLNRFPEAKLTLIDFAENMLDVAKEKFADRVDVSYLLDDYYTHDYEDSRFDIVISALSIHHLEARDKLSFYIKLFSLLNTGGELINADIFSSESPEINERFDVKWTSFVAGNIGEGEYFDRFMKSKDIDNPSSISDQLEWLGEAGFQHTDCVFKHYNFAVLYAKK